MCVCVERWGDKLSEFLDRGSKIWIFFGGGGGGGGVWL